MEENTGDGLSSGTIVEVLPEWDLVYVENSTDRQRYPFGLQRLRRNGIEPREGMPARLLVDPRKRTLETLEVMRQQAAIKISARPEIPAGSASPRATGAAEHCLDPDDKDQIAVGAEGSATIMPATDEYPELKSNTLKQAVAAGLVPDVEQLRPGDLLLFAPKSPNRGEQILISMQQEFGAMHAAWSHAAVFTGGYGICEGTLDKGTHASSMFRFLGNRYRIKVRRPKPPEKASNSKCVGEHIAVAALRSIPTQYAVLFLAWQALKVWEGKKAGDASGRLCARIRAWMLWPLLKLLLLTAEYLPRVIPQPFRRKLFKQRGLVCAQVYTRAYALALALADRPPLLKPGDEVRVCPALLSLSGELKDVEKLVWLKFVSPENPAAN